MRSAAVRQAVVSNRGAALTAACLAVSVLLLFLTGRKIAPVLDDSLRRTGAVGILALAMLPVSRSGLGLAFGLPIGMISGLLGTLIGIQAGFGGFACFAAAAALASPFSLGLGWAHGRLLERARGNETAVSLAAGLSFTAFMCLPWLLLPFSRSGLSWGAPGSGLRTDIRLADFACLPFEGLFVLDVGGASFGFGLLLPLGLVAAALALVLRRRPNSASGPTASAMLSAWLGGLGISVHQQASGSVLPYLGPLSLVFPAAACLVAGGATEKGAGVGRVLLGVLLLQSLTAVLTALAGGDSRVEQILASGLVFIFLAGKKGGPV